MLNKCTFRFCTDKSFKKVAWALLETPFTFSVILTQPAHKLKQKNPANAGLFFTALFKKVA